ncbi:ComF family protein [Lyngbya sp. CCY1209]|uniref:ComF family protein n=1 Tax=Lyngbya sp. CCY1209 TaxID=2886103 RepID=UPI002D205310|nr:ComF family protein [Lyngbya sp. CCY1209]MEB3887066.1 ComF family protein [Lyngbya sp. CCY1209]
MAHPALKTVLNLFFKPECPLCGRPAETEFCRYCQTQLLRCQFPEGGEFPGDVPVFVWGRYGGALKRAIAALKYDGNPQIARQLGCWLADGWLGTQETLPKNLTVVPIPLHPDKLKKRGFNQAELLARGFCELTGLSLKPHGLERVRDTEALHGLSSAERQKNLQNALRVGKDRPPRPNSVLILDDIYTTGATVNAALRAFKTHRIPVAGVVALATTNTPPPRQRSRPKSH